MKEVIALLRDRKWNISLIMREYVEIKELEERRNVELIEKKGVFIRGYLLCLYAEQIIDKYMYDNAVNEIVAMRFF